MRARFFLPAAVTTVAVAVGFAAWSTAQNPPVRRAAGSDVARGGAYEGCARTCDDCARTCDACGTHCAKLVADGEKHHMSTLRTCLDCATVCRAASAIVAKQGPFSDVICTACADACKRCGEACEKHGGNDEVMKGCAEECRRCERACRDMLQHTGHGETTKPRR